MDAEFFVTASFVLLMALAYALFYPKIIELLDGRRDAIYSELSEADRMYEEAKSLAATFDTRGDEVAKKTEEILEEAGAEAQRLRQEAKKYISDYLERRTQQVEEKVRLAEAQTFRDWQSAIAEYSIALATEILKNAHDQRSSAEEAEQILNVLTKQFSAPPSISVH